MAVQVRPGPAGNRRLISIPVFRIPLAPAGPVCERAPLRSCDPAREAVAESLTVDAGSIRSWTVLARGHPAPRGAPAAARRSTCPSRGGRCSPGSPLGPARAPASDRLDHAHRGRDRRARSAGFPSGRSTPRSTGEPSSTSSSPVRGGRAAVARVALADERPTSCSSCAGRGAAAARARVGGAAERAPHRPRRAPRRSPFDQRRPAASSLGADRRYTGPDCPPEMLDHGGIPQGDYAPVAVAALERRLGRVDARPTAPGTELRPRRARCDLAARAPPGRCACTSSPTRRPPPACARYLRLTGLPGAAARVGLRALEEPRRLRAPGDVEEDLEGYRGHGIPLDAIVLDSPWETQYNTWRFNPHQFPDPRGHDRAAAGRRACGPSSG